MKNPFLKFYPTDWRSDPALRMCSPAARGVWIDMICLMHEATPYGHLLVNGRCPTDAQIAVLLGLPPDQFSEIQGELEAAGVFSRTKDGVIYSRKMTRMAKKDAASRKAGQKGGHPKLTSGYTSPGYVYAAGRREDGAVKIGISVNPRNRVKKIRAQYRGHDIEIIGSIWTENMGDAEKQIHADLASKCAGGEWFFITDNDLKEMGFISDPNGSTKGDPLPQKPEARSQSPEYTEPYGSDGEAVADFLTETVWKRGVPFLCERGVKEGNARSMIGKWLKSHSAQEVHDAFVEAKKAGTGDPIPYITEILKPDVRVRVSDVLRQAAEACNAK